MRIQTVALLGTLGLLVLSCTSQRHLSHTRPTSSGRMSAEYSAVTAEAESPCTDSLYLALKSKPINQMSEREYQYFLQRDKQCMEYQQANAVARTTTQPQTEMVQEVKKANDAYTTWLVIGVIVSLVSLIPLLSSSP